jgi:putative tryptophan/tyrosine transport system substrate-binding protein
MQFDRMKRREFITLLGGAATWPFAARAQQRPKPVIGYLSPADPDSSSDLVAMFRKGLREAGYVEGQNTAIEFRWAHHESDRMPELATDLVRREVAVIAALAGDATARAAKAVTNTVPIVFLVGDDPVQSGIVATLNQPGGYVTGITTMNVDIGPKWLGLLHELLPGARRFAVLVNSENRLGTQSMITQVQDAGLTNDLQTVVLFASTARELDEAVARIAKFRAEALLIMPDAFFLARCEQLAALAMSYRVPAIYAIRNFPQAGGLMSYGSSYAEAHRQAGIYVGRILNGERPGDLPVMRSTKFEFVLNLKTVKALGLDVPPTLLSLADEVIE